MAVGNILTAVERSLLAGIVEDKAERVLNCMDWQLAHAGYRVVRYADDFVILCRTQNTMPRRPSKRSRAFQGQSEGNYR